MKIENEFLEALNDKQLDVLFSDLLERNSIDSLRILYEYKIAKGFIGYYYDLAASYLELKDKKGFGVLKKGADYKDNNCLLALAMFYENGAFNLIKGGYKVIPNKDIPIYYYTTAANNNDIQS